MKMKKKKKKRKVINTSQELRDVGYIFRDRRTDENVKD